ncbi:MAG: hypothetical protein M1497_10565 [Nitrospirae bacterium]|nr:hypothetical protein [Nitrospirota bacterium]
MRSEDRNTLSSALLVVIAVLLIFVSGCKKGAEERGESKIAPKVIVQHGETVLTLDKSAQEKSGIVVAPLKSVFHREEFQAYGTVLRPEALIDIRSSYLAAKASSERAEAALDVSRKEYERLKKLNEDNRNISDKALQAASAALVSNEADAYASRERLQAVKQAALVQWGGVVAEWIFNPSPEFNHLTELNEVLIRITLPSDRVIEAAPASIRIQASGPKLFSARFVSRAPSADRHTQGIGFLYAASSHPFLIPGLNVGSFIPVGPSIKGVIVPFSAVVWSQNKAWAYVQTDPEHFSRREVPTVNPVRGGKGYFVREGFTPGEMAVIAGAQILMSQELLPSQPTGGGEEDEDD